jgi:hypothetical protein
MALTLTVTDAGRAALRNAQGDGTNAVRIATVGVTATAFASGSPVPAEIKRLATIAGGATSLDTIHVTISDTGTDVYSVRGYGFYLADGTLFASYGQADVIVEKSAQATMLLAVDVKFTAIDATQITFGDSNFSNPAATTDTLGVVRLATDAEAIAGADTQKALTAKNLLAAFNDRLGAGAPSAFVKTLLTKASVLAFCTALGIRGAAQYDTGSGNGLDADLLDGKDGSYYLQWANLSGVPSVFAPAPHTHSADDITSGTLPVARGGTGVATIPAGNYVIGGGNGPLQSKAPADVLTDIGAAAKQHSHPISDINGLQAALDAKTTPAAVTAQITAAVNGLINGAPGALDTLKELADAMGDDAHFSATVTNALAGKVAKAGDTMTGTLYGNSVSMYADSYFGGGVGHTDNRIRFVTDGGGSTRIDSIKYDASAFAPMGFYASQYTFMGGGPASFSGRVAMGAGLGVSGGGVIPNAQGSYLSWNKQNGWGDMSFINHHGGGSGGWTFWDTGDGANYTLLAWITGLGVFNGNGLLVPGGTFQGQGEVDVHFNPNGGQGANGYYLSANGTGFTIAMKNSSGGYQASALSVFQAAGGYQVNAIGAIVANGGFQVGSDKRLKKNIRKREVLRGIALRCAKAFSEWELKLTDVHDVGLIAQTLRRFAPWYVRPGNFANGKSGPRMLSVDKAGIALECSMDNALAIDEIMKRIAKLEKRK